MQSAYLPQEEHYHQLSELMLLLNPPQPNIPLYSEISELMDWIQSSSTRPLLITAKQFGGKKVLISELIRHLGDMNKKKALNSEQMKNTEKPFTINSQYIVISQFGSVTSYYSDILYKIMSKLRVSLNIRQKVELNEEKLRQYFRYWLEIADEKVEKEFLGYLQHEKTKIVIIIEGVDKVLDSKQHPVNPTFWLPDIHLKNIKIILSAKSSTPILDSLIGKKIEHMLPEKKIKDHQDKIFAKFPIIKEIFSNPNNKIHYGEIKLIRNILESNPLFEKVLREKSEKVKGFRDFLELFLNYCTDNKLDSVKNFLCCLIWSQKGLGKEALRRSAKITFNEFQKFISFFKSFVLEDKGFYLIMNLKIKEVIEEIFFKKEALCVEMTGDPQNKKTVNKMENFKKQIHSAITKALSKESTTVSTLEESIYHMKKCHNFTELKQLLSRIENFLMLYTPLTKHLLCVCWLQLENQFQYDPVFEYNKAIERFLNHYYPSPEDTFKIIFQLSLFFKEYSEFENSKTPEFRHPYIRGQTEKMKQISIFEELQKMDMFEKSKQRNHEEKRISKSPKQTESNRASQISQQKSSRKSANEDDQQLIEEPQNNQVKEVENLNVKIKFHQQKFRRFYVDDMEPYINEYFTLKERLLLNQKQNLLDEDSDDEENEFDESKIDQEKEKAKKELILKSFSDYCEEVYHRKSQQRSFYYYKQWIWMQFPWICQSLQNDYSILIEECMRSPTEYMSIEKESNLILEALKIATMAKQNKDQIYKKDNIETSSIQVNIQKKKMKEKEISERKKKREEEKFIKGEKKPNKSEKRVQIGEKRSLERSGKKNSEKYLKNKLNLSLLDEEIENNISYLSGRRGRNHDKANESCEISSVFMTDVGMAQSMISEKENCHQSRFTNAHKLPSISKVSSLAATRLKAKKNNITEVREYKVLLSKLDEIKYENKKLIEKIEFLKQNNPQLNKKELKAKLIAEISDIKSKTEGKIKNYENQKALKHKLETIIKLCDINKSHGSESQHLNNFLNSLKIMFKSEAENLVTIEKETKQMVEKCKSQNKQLKEEKKNVITKLKKERQKQKISLLLLKKESERNQKNDNINNAMMKVKPQKGGGKIKSQELVKKQQKIEKQMEGLRKIEQYLKQNFGLLYDPESNEKNYSKINEIQGKVEKMAEIQWQLNQLKEENRAKIQQITSLKSELNILENMEFHEKEQQKKHEEEEINQIMSRDVERKECLLKCLSILRQNSSLLQQQNAVRCHE